MKSAETLGNGSCQQNAHGWNTAANFRQKIITQMKGFSQGFPTKCLVQLSPEHRFPLSSPWQSGHRLMESQTPNLINTLVSMDGAEQSFVIGVSHVIAFQSPSIIQSKRRSLMMPFHPKLVRKHSLGPATGHT